MDDFEKLGRLVGVAVEAVPGEGPPRTKAEAKALGLPRYFTGAPCKHGHVAERYAMDGHCAECSRQRSASRERKEYQRQYNATPGRKEYDRKRNASPERRERRRQYEAKPERKEYYRQRDANPERKERQRQYNASPERRERQRQRELQEAGDATLFAINQAEQAARKARAPADIVPQCPEPHRSQLQALIDRIRADPTAGKAVVGLLQTMRELRKAELAQQRADIETTTAAESNT